MELSGSQRKRSAQIKEENLVSPQAELGSLEEGNKKVPEAEREHVGPPKEPERREPEKGYPAQKQPVTEAIDRVSKIPGKRSDQQGNQKGSKS